MKQRSAMVVAAGLVVALALAGLGLAMGMTGPSADAKAPKLHRKPPIVHTTTRTITVHQPGTAASTGGATTYSGPQLIVQHRQLRRSVRELRRQRL